MACSIFSATVRPLLRSKSADCLATTVSFWSATLWKPSPRSRVADAPGMPSSSATFTFSPSFWMMYSAAISPPLTLSEAMKEATVPLSALRSSARTGMLALLAAATEVDTAAESTGLMSSTSTFCWIRSEISLACFAGSFCASTILTLTPSFFASSSTPLRTDTKKGLLSVEMEKPMVVVFLPSAGFAALSLLPQPEVSTASTVMAATKRVQIFFIGECLLSFFAVHKYRQ